MKMSSLYSEKIKQRDNVLKKYLILSKNYKNRYLKQKQYLLTKKSKQISPNKHKNPNKNKKSKISQNNSTSAIFSKKNNNKEEIINGGINIHNSSECIFNKYDKGDNLDEIKYNNFSENLYKSNNTNNYEYINKKNWNYIPNLKKYINSYPKNIKTEPDFLNKQYYFTEKVPFKINIHKLTESLKYLKLQKSVSYNKKRKVHFNYLGTKLNTNPYENETYSFPILLKETREQFSVKKNRTKKFSNLIEDENILLNYYPINKNKLDIFTINSNQIEYINNKEKEKDKNKEKETVVKEILVLNPNNALNKFTNSNGYENNINTKINTKKETKEEQKENNNNSKQFIKFKENLKKKIGTETNKKNDKFKISVKVKRLALGLENHLKNNNDNEGKTKENGIKLNNEKIRIRVSIPTIYKKKRTQTSFEDNKI